MAAKTDVAAAHKARAAALKAKRCRRCSIKRATGAVDKDANHILHIDRGYGHVQGQQQIAPPPNADGQRGGRGGRGGRAVRPPAGAPDPRSSPLRSPRPGRPVTPVTTNLGFLYQPGSICL